MLLSQPETSLILGFIFIWLVIISFLLYRTVFQYRQLTLGVEKKDLLSVLEKILKDQQGELKRVDELVKQTEKIAKDGLFHIQKIALVRFNPFPETGGNQSFALAILDGENSGFVLSSLHSRDNTRIYAKEVKEGKAVRYPFSKEEDEAIKKATQQGK